MPTMNATVDLPAAPEKAWELMATPARYAEWLTIHSGWKGDPPEEIGVGTKLVEVVTMLGMANKIEWTVQEYEPPQLVKISGTGLAGVQVSLALGVHPRDGGSTASIDAEFSGQLLVGPLAEVVKKDALKQLDASLAKLADLLS